MQHTIFKKPRTADETLTLIASLCVLAFPPLLFIGSAGADAALSVTAVLFLVHSQLTSDWKWLREKWIKILLLLWLYMMVRGLFAGTPHEALNRSAPFIRYFIFSAALAHWVMQDKTMRRYFLISFAATLSFIMADGLLQRIRGYDIFNYDILWDALGYIRLSGPFGKKPILGIMLAWLSFPVCLYLLLAQRGRLRSGRRLLIGVAFCLFSLCMIAISGERMALLLALLGWCLAVALMGIRKRMLFGMLLGGAMALGVLAIIVPSIFDRQLKATFNTMTHWQESSYGKILASDLQLARRNPVFGVGANHFRIACPTLYPDAKPDFLLGVCNIHPHNIFMEWLIEEGIIGFALFCAFLACVFRQCRKAWPVMRTNPLYLGWGIAFSLRVWPIGSTTGFFSNWGASPFWLALGMLLVYTVHTDNGENSNAGTSISL